MSYFNNISSAVSTLIDGMKVTMGYFVRPRENVTLQYPDEVWPVPERNIGVGELESYNTIRSKLSVDIDDCIGCKKCERACPVACITIDTHKVDNDVDLGQTSNGTQKRLLVSNFTIDMSECMFCDLCTPPCPEDCIFMTPDFQFISNDNQRKDVTPEQRWRDRGHLIYQFSTVSQEERERLRLEAEEAAQAKALAMEAKRAAAEKAAKAKAEAEAQGNVSDEKPVAERTELPVVERPETVIQLSGPAEEKPKDASEDKPSNDSGEASKSEVPTEPNQVSAASAPERDQEQPEESASDSDPADSEKKEEEGNG